MDELTRIRQLVAESELREEARAEEVWNLLLDSPEFGLRELIEGVGMDTTQARQVLLDARIGDSSALHLIVLGRQVEVREVLLRMIHGHY
jgi:hypothetical protein